MTDQRRGLLTNNGFMALLGASAIMIGTTLPEMIRSFGLTLSQGGLIVSAQSAGGLAAMFTGLLLADRIRKPLWILTAVILIGLLFSLAGLAPGYRVLVVAFFVLGTVTRFLDLLLNAHTGDLAPENRTRSMTILHMVYGIGAFIGPNLARWFLDRSLSWNSVYQIVGGAFFTGAAISLLWAPGYRSFSRAAAEDTVSATAVHPEGDSHETRVQWVSVVLLGLVVMFYAVHQLGTTSWLPYYLEHTLGVRPALASAGLSFYWAGIIGSRFLVSRIGSRVGETRVLVWGGVSGGAVLVGSVLLASPAVAIVGFVLAGVLTGATIPVTMALAHGHLPGKTGSVTAVVYGLMVIGRLIGPWSIGSVGDRLGLKAGILIAAGVLIVAALAAWIVALRDRRLSD